MGAWVCPQAPKYCAQILNDALGVGFAVAIIRKTIYGEVDVRFAKAQIGIFHNDEIIPQDLAVVKCEC